MKHTNTSHIPPDARRVFKGVLYEIWQWDQRMFDKSIEIFECIARSDSVDVIAVAEDKILLQRQRQPDNKKEFVSFPGGRRDEGENPLQTGKRELLEEMGYQSQDWILWRRHGPTASSRLKWTLYTYIARNCVKVAQPVFDAGEKIKEIRISFNEFLLLPENPAFRHKDLEAPILRARYCKAEREFLFNLLFGSKAIMSA